MMKMPFLESLRVDQSKITGYLLNETSGRGKATFFLRLGFRVDDWGTLAEAIKAQARENAVTFVVDSPYGKRYSVDGTSETPDNREPRPRIRTVWILESDTEVP
jgi:hypothetical protein